MFDDVRAALFAMTSHPLAVAALILLTGIHAAVWCLVFERLGYPPIVAAWLLLPPFAFFMPLVLVVARWPKPETARVTTRFRRASSSPVRRVVRRAFPTGPLSPPESFGGRRPLILAADGLPRVRISLAPSHREPSQEDTLFRPLGDGSALHYPAPHPAPWP